MTKKTTSKSKAKQKAPKPDPLLLGSCPNCGASNMTDVDFEYGNWEMDGEMGWYEVSCPKCGKGFREVYELNFIQNEPEE